MVSKRIILWDTEARDYLRKAISYIKKDSPQNAELVKARIFASIKALPENPYKYPQDKFRKDSDVNYRAYEITRFRIAYYVSDDTIYILRIRHVNMEPQEY